MFRTIGVTSAALARWRARPPRASWVLVSTLSLCGCIATDVELIGPDRGLKLAGSRFSGRGEDGEAMVFTWNEERRAYLHEFEGGLVQVRFARLKGDVYLGQAQKQEHPRKEPRDPADQYGYAVGLVRRAGSRLAVNEQPRCPGVGEDVGALAPRYGVEYEHDDMVAGARGTPAALLAWLAAIAECPHGEPGGFLDIERFTPGGEELATGSGTRSGRLPDPTNPASVEAIDLS